MSSNIITIKLNVTNMTCVNCENTIERKLSETPGVVSVQASYSKGTAIVTYDESIISPDQIIAVLAKEDYYAEPLNTSEPNGLHTQSEVQSESQNMNHSQSRSKSSKEGSKGVDYTNVLGLIIIVFALYMIANRFGLLNIFNNFPVAKDGMGYGMLFVIGLLTSVHCVAMCGGICISQCVPQKEGIQGSRFAALRPSLLYNLGRVMSYTVIGGIVGAIGSVVSFSGAARGIVQILAGVFMVIMGLNMLNVFPWLRRFNPRMPKIFAKKIYAHRQSNSPLYIGLLNGLMPCGPLQAMQLYALSTGSPIKGAISMFLFSVGTVPLMFAFGALSSFLSKKFTAKMMTASAVLVVFLGIFMFNNGIGLSGIALPTLPALAATSNQKANIAVIDNGVQVVTSKVTSGGYEPIIVQKGVPVKWTMVAEDGQINGCNNSIIIQKFNLQKKLEVGDNIIEFTPTESGNIPFSCWMGMIRSKITVVDDLNNVDDATVAAAGNTGGSAGGGCCGAGGGAYAGSGNTGSTTGSDGSGSTGSSSGGLSQYNNLLDDVKLPTDQVAIAKEAEDGTQSVELTYNQDGFSPAIIVVQRGAETIWNIKGDSVSESGSTLIFPLYGAKLDVAQGDNQIKFIPDQDFDFFVSDNSFYGLVKVVDDINNVDIEAIKEEAANFSPSDYNVNAYGGAGSCH